MTLRQPGCVDISQANWAPGQAYVALSRFSSLSLITVLSSVSAAALANVNALAVAFYKAADREAAALDADVDVATVADGTAAAGRSGASASSSAPASAVSSSSSSSSSAVVAAATAAAATVAAATATAAAAAAAAAATPPGARHGTAVLSYQRLVHHRRPPLDSLVFFDVEHTGGGAMSGRIVQVGLVACDARGHLKPIGTFLRNVNPGNVRSSRHAARVHQLSRTQLRTAQSQLQAFKDMIKWMASTLRDFKNVVLIAHRGFGVDFAYLAETLWRLRLQLPEQVTPCCCE